MTRSATKPIGRAATAIAAAFHGPLARASVSTLILRIANIFLGVTTTILLARALGVEGFGVFSAGFACATLLSGLFLAGLRTHVMQTTAGANAKQDWATLNGVLQFSIFAALTAGAIVYGAVFLGALFVGDTNSATTSLALVIGAAIAPIMFLDSAASSLLQGLGKISRAFAPQFVIMQIAFLLTVIGALVLDFLSPISALALFGGAYVLSAAMSWYWVLRQWPQDARRKAGEISGKFWVGRSINIFLTGLPNIIFGRLEVILLAMSFGPAAAGVYAIAFRFAQFTTLPGFAVASGLSPAVSALAAQEQWAAALAKVRHATRIISVLTVIFAIGVQFLVWILFPIINPEFQNAVILVGVISVGYVLQAIAGQPILMLIVKNQIASGAVVGVVIALIGVLCVGAVVPFTGPVGAGIATATIIGGAAWALCFVLWRRCEMRSDIFSNLSGFIEVDAPGRTPTHRAAE